MTGGSTGSGSGFLNAFKKMNIYTGDDNVSTTTWYHTPVEHELCAAVDLMFHFDAVVWPNNSIEYGPKLGPNSNTFARWLGERTGLTVFSAPPGAYGWDYPGFFLLP